MGRNAVRGSAAVLTLFMHIITSQALAGVSGTVWDGAAVFAVGHVLLSASVALTEARDSGYAASGHAEL